MDSWTVLQAFFAHSLHCIYLLWLSDSKFLTAMLDRRSKPPSVNRQRHIRERWLNDDVVLRRCLLFIILHHRHRFSHGRMVKWYFGNISHKQIKLIALSLFTRRHRVSCSTNYPWTWTRCAVQGHCNGTRYVVRQVSCRYIECCSFCR